jgi:hypothetical protein
VCVFLAVLAAAFIRLLGPCVEILKRNADTYKRYSNVLRAADSAAGAAAAPADAEADPDGGDSAAH